MQISASAFRWSTQKLRTDRPIAESSISWDQKKVSRGYRSDTHAAQPARAPRWKDRAAKSVQTVRFQLAAQPSRASGSKKYSRREERERECHEKSTLTPGGAGARCAPSGTREHEGYVNEIGFWALKLGGSVQCAKRATDHVRRLASGTASCTAGERKSVQ